MSDWLTNIPDLWGSQRKWRQGSAYVLPSAASWSRQDEAEGLISAALRLVTKCTRSSSRTIVVVSHPMNVVVTTPAGRISGIL
jgi:hypothetical protein